MTWFKPATRVRIWLLLILLLLFFIPPITCLSNEMSGDGDFIGIWKGSIVTSQGENPVDLTVTAPEDTRLPIKYTFHYGPPRSCKLNAVKTSQENNTFVFDEASGGFCDKLWKGTMVLKRIDEKHVNVDIKKSAVSESTELTKQMSLEGHAQIKK